MLYFRYEAPGGDVVIGRHNVTSTHSLDADDLTVAFFAECDDDCSCPVSERHSIREGEEIITEAEFASESDRIRAINAKLVVKSASPSPKALDPDEVEQLRALLRG